MVYTRAEDHQIKAWEEAGNADWNWETLFSHFKKSERLVRPDAAQVERWASFIPEFHGFGGPVTTGWAEEGEGINIFSKFRDSFGELHVPFSKDLGGGHMRGFGVGNACEYERQGHAIPLQSYPRTLTPGNASYPDVRADSGRSYFYPYQTRSNLHIMT